MRACARSSQDSQPAELSDTTGLRAFRAYLLTCRITFKLLGVVHLVHARIIELLERFVRVLTELPSSGDRLATVR